MRLVLAAIIIMLSVPAQACDECYINGYYMIGYKKGADNRAIPVDGKVTAKAEPVIEVRPDVVQEIGRADEPQPQQVALPANNLPVVTEEPVKAASEVKQERTIIADNQNKPLLVAEYTLPDDNAGWERIISEYKKKNAAKKAGR